jgi:hypothetical protein
MRKQLVTPAVLAVLLAAVSCTRDGLLVYPRNENDASLPGGAGGSQGGPPGTGGVLGSAGGRGGLPGLGGGGVSFQIPDAGLAALLGDGGLLGGLLDSGVLSQALCGPEVRLGASCSGAIPACLLPSLGGVCACVSGTYLCPLSTAAPKPCPPGAATGGVCLSPLSTCTNGTTGGCFCGMGTYTCL